MLIPTKADVFCLFRILVYGRCYCQLIVADVITTYTTLRLMLLPPVLPMLTDVAVNYYEKILYLAITINNKKAITSALVAITSATIILLAITSAKQ